MHRVLVLCCCLCWLLASDAGLDQAIKALPAGSQASVCLIELPSGAPLAAHRDTQATRLASVTKLFVSAAALIQFGEEHLMSTRIHGLGPVVEGSIPGLLLQGGGSPCLDEHFSDGKPEAIMQHWIEQLQAAGIRRIDGPVLVDGSLFVGPQRPPTYPQDHSNLQKWYSAPASAFAWLDNCIEVQVRPGPKPGDPAEVHTRPHSPRITITNKTRTVAKVSHPKLIVSRAHHANHIIASGSYDRPTAWYPMAIDADADLLHADHFCHLLRQAGIQAPERAERGRLSEQSSTTLLVEQADRLGPAITILNQRSQNFYGEQILRLLAVARDLQGSIDQGCEAVTGILGESGIECADLTLLDGCGLSYDNRASARDVCELLRAMHEREEGAFFRSSLKDLTHDGIDLKVKTGTLAVARCLAGYFDRGQRRFAFAILIERSNKSGAWLSKAKQGLNGILSRLLRIAGNS